MAALRKSDRDVLVEPGKLAAEPTAGTVPSSEGGPIARGAPTAKGEPEPQEASEPQVIEFVEPDAELLLPCGHPTHLGAKFCPECGATVSPPVPQPWSCGNGHPNDAGIKFCPECGAQRPGLVPAVEAVGAPVQQRPRPDAELTPEQLAERAREHQQALRLGAQMPRQQYLRAVGENKALFHFLEDGYYAFGNVWYRGQEAEVDLDGPRGAEASGMLGMDDFRQMRELGKVYFRQGPWPGLSYADGVGKYQRLRSDGGAEILGPSVDELMQAEASERARGRAVPAPIL